jgi:hypothetical protein
VPLKRLSRQGQQGTASGGERSFDDLVGAGEDRWRDRQPECRCGLEVDDKVEFYRLLDGQVAGFRSFQDPVYIIRRPPEVVGHIGAVRDQAATIGVLPFGVDGGQPRRIDEPDDLSAVAVEHPVWKDDDRAGFREDGWAQRAQSRGARDIDSGDIPQTQRGGGCLTMPRIEVAKLFYKWADTFAGRVDRPPANRRRRART